MDLPGTKNGGVLTMDLASRERLKENALLTDQVFITNLKQFTDPWQATLTAISLGMVSEHDADEHQKGWIKTQELDNPNSERAIWIAELGWLQERGFVETYDPDFLDSSRYLDLGLLFPGGRDLLDPDWWKEIQPTFFLRADAKALERKLGMIVVPLMPPPNYSKLDEVSAPKPEVDTEVLHVTLSAIPVPDASTPWEAILDFKADPDNKARLLALRRWMRKIAKDSLSKAEIEDELSYLLNEFERHMSLQKMKANRGVVEALVVGTAEIIEDTAKIKWGKVAERLFTRKKKIQLMEAEANAPGKEISYIATARSRFVR